MKQTKLIRVSEDFYKKVRKIREKEELKSLEDVLKRRTNLSMSFKEFLNLEVGNK